jgi:Trp operon repressor
MKQHLKTVAEANKHLNLHVCFSAPDEQDTLGEDYHIVGRNCFQVLFHTLPAMESEREGW